MKFTNIIFKTPKDVVEEHYSNVQKLNNKFIKRLTRLLNARYRTLESVLVSRKTLDDIENEARAEIEVINSAIKEVK